MSTKFERARGGKMNVNMYRKAIKIEKPFKGLFPVENHILNALITDMKANGFDPSFPVTIWKGICLDGHVRLRAAGAAGINIVPVSIKDFPGEGEALRYQIHCQRDRRDMTDADIVRCVAVVDKRMTKAEAGAIGGSTKQGSSDPCLNESTAETTARLVGTSASKVKKIRTIMDHAGEETKTAVKAGKKSIHGAYIETQEKRKGRY